MRIGIEVDEAINERVNRLNGEIKGQKNGRIGQVEKVKWCKGGKLKKNDLNETWRKE